ncbi:MAG: tetratricopeptide (TPR) repeat protein [Alphaproteobacteria bacterium]|jgi:tetratricopeptide (TPR) repeat protein
MPVLFALPKLAAALILAAAQGSPPTAGQDYGACMALARTAPDQALKQAKALWAAGQRAASRHCVGTALRKKGRAAQAAKVLFDLARDSLDAPAAERAELYAQAAGAWIDAGHANRADDAYGLALSLQPDDAALYIARAVVRGAQGKNFEALEDLNTAIERAPGNAEAWVLRAAAWRRVGSLDLARQDIAASLKLAPQSPGAWLERGLVLEALNDRNGARTAFTKAATLDPSGTTGVTARAALKRLAGGR